MILKNRRWLIALLLIFLIAAGMTLFVLLNNNQSKNNNGAEAGETGEIVETVVAYGWEEIINHDQRHDCWIVLDITVYDVSDWEYPGTTDLTPVCGKLDASEHFADDSQEAPPAEFQIGVWPRHGIQ